MTNQTRRYPPLPEEEPLELGDVLEPYDGRADDGFAPEKPAAYGEEEEDAYDDPYPPDAYDAPPYEDDEADMREYSDEHEALDHEQRLHTAIGVFDTVSALVGVLVILVLVAMLLSLITWLRTDIVHSITLLQSGLQ